MMESKPMRYAIVTGANKGIGLEVCRQLIANDITVILTARDEQRGLEALKKLKESGCDDITSVMFHQLDVTDPSTIHSLVDFVKTKFGKLDILVVINGFGSVLNKFVERMAKGVLNDVENLTEERIDDVVKEFLKDCKDGKLESKGWPKIMAGYIVSKAALNGYTRHVAKKFSGILVNCACRGFSKTYINDNTGVLSVEEGAESLVRLVLLLDNAPSRVFFNHETKIISF